MRCPLCQKPDMRVIDSRLVEENNQVRRRRECSACNERFTTYESVREFRKAIPRLEERKSYAK